MSFSHRKPSCCKQNRYKHAKKYKKDTTGSFKHQAMDVLLQGKHFFQLLYQLCLVYFVSTHTFVCSHLYCYIWSTSRTEMLVFYSHKHFTHKRGQMTWTRQFDCVCVCVDTAMSINFRQLNTWDKLRSGGHVCMQGKDASSFTVGQHSGRNNR